ncbi:MAG: formylglycine-generating enzyme family protein, partial [Gemmataceae bacterium]|nr:formylglycine-generating enzyme family protein [Gemmataceae bacterium]
VTGSHAWVQWHRRMVYHTFRAMECWFPEIVASWRASDRQLGPEGNRRLATFLGGDNFRKIPEGVCQFGSDPIENVPGVKKFVDTFRMHRYLVTNIIYKLFDNYYNLTRGFRSMGLKRRQQGGDRCPVVNVTWYDAWCFSAWCGCVLPTEEQWEHAYRAGERTRFWFGDEERDLPDFAWFEENSRGKVHPVGMRPVLDKEHPHGVYDMAGNIWELCDSWIDSNQVSRVMRGGSWLSNAWDCRAATREGSGPRDLNHHVGFRLCRSGPG